MVAKLTISTEDEELELAYSWNLTNFTTGGLEFLVDFEEPLLVSDEPNPDFLILELDKGFFLTPESDKTLPTRQLKTTAEVTDGDLRVSFKAEIPRQLASQEELEGL